VLARGAIIKLSCHFDCRLSMISIYSFWSPFETMNKWHCPVCCGSSAMGWPAVLYGWLVHGLPIRGTSGVLVPLRAIVISSRILHLHAASCILSDLSGSGGLPHFKNITRLLVAELHQLLFVYCEKCAIFLTPPHTPLGDPHKLVPTLACPYGFPLLHFDFDYGDLA
jgi:hypothetical protein